MTPRTRSALGCGFSTGPARRNCSRGPTPTGGFNTTMASYLDRPDDLAPAHAPDTPPGTTRDSWVERSELDRAVAERDCLRAELGDMRRERDALFGDWSRIESAMAAFFGRFTFRNLDPEVDQDRVAVIDFFNRLLAIRNEATARAIEFSRGRIARDLGLAEVSARDGEPGDPGEGD
jgi:hypothetical protein